MSREVHPLRDHPHPSQSVSTIPSQGVLLVRDFPEEKSLNAEPEANHEICVLFLRDGLFFLVSQEQPQTKTYQLNGDAMDQTTLDGSRARS